MNHYCCKAQKKKLFTQEVIEHIESCLDDLKSHPDQIDKMDSIKTILLETQVKLTDAVVEMMDNWEMTEGYYRYNEEEGKPEYVIWMTKRMEDQFMEIIKDDPAFKLELEDIARDEDYPETRRKHIAMCLSTLVFNYILDNLKSQKEAKLRQCKFDSTEKESSTTDIPDFKGQPISDIKMYLSNGINVDPSANTFTFKNNQQA